MGVRDDTSVGRHRASLDGKQLETFVADVLRTLGKELENFRLESRN
jgi:hypothetical protein